AEGQHMGHEQGPNRNSRIETAEQPRRLHLLPFSLQNARRESRTLLIVFSDKAATTFDFMTANTVVLVHEPSPVGDLNSPGAVIRQITGGNPAIAEAGVHDSPRLDRFVGQVELWHY